MLPVAGRLLSHIGMTPPSPIVIEGIAWLPWLAILPATALLCHERTRKAGLLAAAAGYGLAFVIGQLTPISGVALALLALAGLGATRESLGWKVAGHVLFLGITVALRMHVVPGFENPLAIHAVFSEGAAPFKAYLNLDKTVAAIWVIAAIRGIDLGGPVGRRIAGGAGIGVAGLLALGSVALGAGVVAFEPKLPEGGWLWLVNNVLLVCFAEEVLFRGYIQGGMRRLMGDRRFAGPAAIAAASVIFGAAHVGQPIEMQALTVLAGVAYGIAYERFGLIGAISAHSTLNIGHFLLLTYPWLA